MKPRLLEEIQEHFRQNPHLQEDARFIGSFAFRPKNTPSGGAKALKTSADREVEDAVAGAQPTKEATG